MHTRHLVASSRSARGPLLALGLLLLASPLGGCEDSAARGQTAARKEIDAVVDALRVRSIGTPSIEDGDTIAKRREEFGALAARLDNLSGAGSGQQAAAALLGSRIAADMGQLGFDRLASLQGNLRFDRAALSPLVDAGIQLELLGATAASFDPSKDQAELERLRVIAVGALDIARRQVDDLAKPLGQLAGDRESTRAALAALDSAEAALRAQARSAGPVAGFTYVEQAALKRTEADALRIRIAQNELQVSELDPQRSLATLEAEQRTQVIATLDGAKADLESMRTRSGELATTARARVAQIRGEIVSGLAAIDATLNGAVATLYSDAEQDFTRAAELAQRAAGGSSSGDAQGAARAAAAAAQGSLAELHWNHALTLRDQAAFVSRVAGAKGLVDDPAALNATAATLTTASDVAVEQAKAAASAALEAVGQAGGDRPQTAQLKENLAALLDAMSGKARVDAAPAAGTPTSDAPGFESPEALLEYITKADYTQVATIRSLGNLYRATSSASKGVFALTVIGFEDGAEYIVALQEKFGPEVLTDPELAGGATLPSGKDLSVGEIKDSKATLVPTAPGVAPVQLVKAGGRWYVDFDAVLSSGGASAAELKTSAEMMKSIGPMLTQVRPAMRETLVDMAKRVRAGEFTTPAEAKAAMAQAMGESVGAAMMEAMGGAGADEMKKMMESAAKEMQKLSPDELKKLMEQAGQNGGVPGQPPKTAPPTTPPGG